MRLGNGFDVSVDRMPIIRMSKNVKYKIIFCFLAFLLVMTGCEREVLLSNKPEEPSEEKVQIEIFTRVDSYRLPSTKGVNDESKLGMTPWILVFKGNDAANATFVEAVQAFEMAGKRYVLLTRQLTGTKYQLLILANPQSHFYYGDANTGHAFTVDKFNEKLIKGVTSLSIACANLLTEPMATPSHNIIPYSGVGETIPMSYLLQVDGISSSTKIENTDGSSLELIRAVSKIVIVNNAANFIFKGITSVVNASRQGVLHNYTGVISGTSGLTELRYDNSYSSPLVVASAVSGGQSTANRPVYLYESPVSNNTYFIIQGTYEGRDYFYKMAIVDTNQALMVLERNKSYTFTIRKAHGPGYDTVADAKVSKPSNTDLDYGLLIDDSNTYEMMANNDYYLGVSNSIFFTYANEDANYEAFKLITDCKRDFPNSNSISDESSAADGAYHVVSPTQIPIAGNSNPDPNITSVVVNVKNTLQNYRAAYVTLKLGNLEKLIHINRRSAVDARGERIKYMPTTNTDPAIREENYYCLSAYVEDNVTYNPKNWIKLRPSSGDERNDTDNITVDDGTILIDVLSNTSTNKRSGIVYLTTINNNSSSGMTTQRIKIDITQLGGIPAN